MNVSTARVEVQRMLVPFQALKNLEEVLEVAAKVESEQGAVARDLANTKAELSAVQADLKLTNEQYALRSSEIKSNLDRLRLVYDEQEKTQRDQLDALQKQLTETEKAVVQARKHAEREAQNLSQKAVDHKADLEAAYAARKLQLELEESAARERLESAKAELSALLKRVSG